MNTTEVSPEKSWLERRTRLEKYLLLIFSILCIIIALLAVGLSCNYTGGQCKTEVCLSETCAKTAAEILESLNKSIDPCEDFYEFACGNTIKNMKIPKDESFVTVFSEIENKIIEETQDILEELIDSNKSNRPFSLLKEFYEACMNETSIKENAEVTLRKLLDDLGGWPVIEGDSWNEDDFAWTNFTWNSRKRGLSVKYFLGFYIGIDSKNTTRRILEITQPDFLFPREMLLTDNVKHYFDYMVDVAVYLGADRTRAQKELNESLEFEIKLSNSSLKPEERENHTELYNLITVRDLQKTYPKINWLEYINNLLAPEAEIDENEVIVLEEPGYLSSLENLVTETPNRTQANYAIWKIMQEVMDYLPSNFTTLRLNLLKKFLSVLEQVPRWKQCSVTVKDNFQPLISALYVRKYFDKATKTYITEIVKYLKDAFINNLRIIDWMDEETRKSAIEKAQNIIENLAYPVELLDDNELRNLFKDLELKANDYLNSALKLSMFDNKLENSRFRLPINKTEWITHSMITRVGAHYTPLENSINVPAGILQGVLFSKLRPMYMNFGAIGSVIGHEITHGFDISGRQFDKNANLNNWWGPIAEKRFINKTQCIIDQYGNYTVNEIKQSLDGMKTKEENIADNGGIKQAYAAYRAWKIDNGEEAKLPGVDYNPNQLFWISAARNWCARYKSSSILKVLIAIQKHTIEKYRVIGPFSNSEEFSQDFKCPKGSKMNPVHKCSVW